MGEHALFQTAGRVFEGQVEDGTALDAGVEDPAAGGDSLGDLQGQPGFAHLRCAGEDGQTDGQDAGDRPDRLGPDGGEDVIGGEQA